MFRRKFRLSIAVLSTVAAGALGCAPTSQGVDDSPGLPDPAFAALQVRGQEAMGVDQYTSTHLFDALPDGGRIELQRDVDDPAGVAEIRRHLIEIRDSFAAGDFSTPAFVHMQQVPGTSVMAAKREAIMYAFRDLPRGGEVRITTSDPEALEAIRQFMAFQRQDHRAGGADHGTMDHGSTHQEGTAPVTGGNPSFADDMGVVHELLVNHQSIRRTVTNLANGIRTITESDDPRVARYLMDHVASMERRLQEGDVFNMGSPSLPTIFDNSEKVRTDVEQTATGVVVTQTSDDPLTVAALQAHAAEVSDLVREGMVAMMRSMMSNGGDMGHLGAGEHRSVGEPMIGGRGMMHDTTHRIR
jgi:hypothetical protein